MNVALKNGQAAMLQEMFKQSDYRLDIQALVMDMDVMYETARRIVEAGPDGYARTVAATNVALETLLKAKEEDQVPFSRVETRWLGKIEKAISGLPEDPAELRARLNPEYLDLFLPAEYGMA
jgi:methanol-cobalamin methyltransferase B subunit